MKAAVFSDTHANTGLMVEAVRRYHPDVIIHLGAYETNILPSTVLSACHLLFHYLFHTLKRTTTKILFFITTRKSAWNTQYSHPFLHLLWNTWKTFSFC